MRGPAKRLSVGTEVAKAVARDRECRSQQASRALIATSFSPPHQGQLSVSVGTVQRMALSRSLQRLRYSF